MAETFFNKLYFIGLSVSSMEVEKEERTEKRIYISMGTVDNKELIFTKIVLKLLKTLTFM